MRENELLSTLQTLFAAADPSVLTGCGPDDCAHIRADGHDLSLSIDTFTEGSHFTSDAPARLVARKSLGASLSDLAASACRARWALATLCLKQGAAENWAEEFAEELAGMAKQYAVSVVGGDTVSSPFSTTVTVAVVGEPLPGGPLLRGGALPGDVLAVSGSLGGSILGRHLRPEPRLREIAWLMAACGTWGKECLPHAAMDLSDGLALDASRLCRESGVGALLDAEAIPLSAAALELAERSGLEAVEHALGDGEDFELLIALPPKAWERYLESDKGAASGLVPFTRVGEATAGRELLLRQKGGLPVPLRPRGYEHRW